MSAKRSCKVILEHYSACARLASRPVPAGAPWRRIPVVVVGAVISQTGAHADLAQEYAPGPRPLARRGQRRRRAARPAGGAARARRRLAGAARRRRSTRSSSSEEKVDLLIGPYGSAATLVAASESRARAPRHGQRRRARRRRSHARGPRYLFQTALPYSAYGAGAAADRGRGRPAAPLHPRARRPASREAAEALRAAAPRRAHGGTIEVYKPGTLDYAAAGGEGARGAGASLDRVRRRARRGRDGEDLQAPGLRAAAFLRAAAPRIRRFIALLGQDAEWQPGRGRLRSAPRRPGARFRQGFHGQVRPCRPGLAAAEGYAAGSVLARGGARRRHAFTQEKLRAALAELEHRHRARRIPRRSGQRRADRRAAAAWCRSAAAGRRRRRAATSCPIRMGRTSRCIK